MVKWPTSDGRLMRLVPVVALLFLAGCIEASTPQGPASDVVAPESAAPEPVEIHDVIDLAMEPTGVQRTWSFNVAEGATEVSMRFFATGKAAAGGTGLTCLGFETPEMTGAAGVCAGVPNVNLVVSPTYVVNEVNEVANQVANERVFFESSEPVPGSYSFTLDAKPSATDFHAVVHVAYG